MKIIHITIMIFKLVAFIKHYILKSIKQLTYCFFCIILSVNSYSQTPIYKHFGVDEGLPSSQIYDILQDKEGNIWFATDKGVSRYNGYEFQNFDMNDGLPGNVVLRFYPQENGQIWAYTFHNKSLFYFNQKFDGFTSYKHNKLLNDNLESNSIVKSVYINEKKTLEIGGFQINGILYISNSGTLKRQYTSSNKNQKHIVLKKSKQKTPSYFISSNKKIQKKYFSTNDTLKSNHLDVSWLTHNKKAIFMDGNTIEIVDINNKVKKIVTKDLTIGLKVIDSTHFLVGYYNGGAKILNTNGETLYKYLNKKSVTRFLIDHEGGYWFTTLNSGVYYVKKPSIIVSKPEDKNVSLHINSLVKKGNKLLIGYEDGSFGKIGANRKLEFKKSFSNSYPSIVEYDSFNDKTYIYKNNILFVNGIYYHSSSPLKITESVSKNTMFSSDRTSYSNIYKNKTHTFPKRVQDVSVWKKDTLIATPFGVYKKSDSGIVDLSKKSKLFGYRSDDIDINTEKNQFFIATQGVGVVVYGKTIFNISTNDGLISNIVNEVYVENDSIIWACTNKGLSRILFDKKNDFEITNIDKERGLLSNQIEDIEIINDTLWIGTKDGLCYLPKKEIDQKKTNLSYFTIKEIKVNDINYNKIEGQKLSYKENKINFLIEAISFANNNNINYSYRLKEIDSKWSKTKNRNISFPNLKDGNYTFQAKVCIGNRCYENHLLEHQFTITPPFWKSWWFRTLLFFISSTLIYLFFKIRVLTYNKDIIRELLRLLINKLKNDEKFLEIRINGENLKISTSEILFIKSSGNYLDIFSNDDKKHTIRCKIGDFISLTPDPLEYLRIHRSYIIRIDKVSGKSKKSIKIKNETIPVGETYVKQLDKIHF